MRMPHKNKLNHVFFFLVSVFTFVWLASCTHSPGIVGRWRVPETNSTLEFHKDGTFKAVDNMDMTVSGRYTFHKNGDIIFEIKHPVAAPEIVRGKLVVQGDELTFISSDHRETERYKKEK